MQCGVRAGTTGNSCDTQAGQICCPLTNECVTAAAACTPPTYPEPAPAPAPVVPGGPVCTTDQYCCPDALKCLTPTSVSCAADANICAGSFLRCSWFVSVLLVVVVVVVVGWWLQPL